MAKKSCFKKVSETAMITRTPKTNFSNAQQSFQAFTKGKDNLLTSNLRTVSFREGIEKCSVDEPGHQVPRFAGNLAPPEVKKKPRQDMKGAKWKRFRT